MNAKMVKQKIIKVLGGLRLPVKSICSNKQKTKKPEIQLNYGG
jgi:hypothetical protein